MPYNVDTWKTKELVDLQIPFESFFKHERKDWHPDVTYLADGRLQLTSMESEGIIGKLEDGDVHVESINFSGEGSGTMLAWIIIPALEDSTGKLVATRIWEGGDSIDRLVVEDGEITEEDIEL
jgi:hypothetical protein